MKARRTSKNPPVQGQRVLGLMTARQGIFRQEEVVVKAFFVTYSRPAGINRDAEWVTDDGGMVGAPDRWLPVAGG
jgi:hypothetical protein